MLAWTSLFIFSLLYGIIDIFAYKSITRTTINYNKFQTLLILIIYAIFSAFVSSIYGGIRIILNFFLVLFLLKTIFKENLAKTTISALFILLSFSISEMIYGFVGGIILGFDLKELSKQCLGIVCSNSVIAILTYIFYLIKPVKKYISDIIEWYRKKSSFNLIFLLLIGIVTIFIILYKNVYNDLNYIEFIFNNLFCLTIIIFVFGFFKEKAINNKLAIEYDNLLEYVKSYEKIVVEKSKRQHEYKNQLILIRGMIASNDDDSKVTNYIDKQLNLEIEDPDYQWLEKLENIPSGGLKGLIYYKIAQMRKKNIDVFVDVSEVLSKKELWKICEEQLDDVSKVIGVYVDNAMEATSQADLKSILIEVDYEDKKIKFTFSNTYKGTLDISKMDNEGYTTKGKGKGYGLSLVKDILYHNKLLLQTRELNGRYYVQKLYINTEE